MFLVTALNRTDILTLLPESESIGAIGTYGKKYPIPTLEQVIELFNLTESLQQKIPHGFDRIE